MGSKLAVQMYTIRDFCGTRSDLAESLKKSADIGYKAVQISGVGAMGGDPAEVSAKEGRKMLDDNGLKCIATHRGWDQLANATDAEIEFHQTLGCDYTAIGGMPGPYAEKKADGYSQFCKDAQPVIAKLKAAGIQFGFHNHAHEFEVVGPGERTLYDILIEEGGPDFMMEVDVFWVHVGRNNPVDIINRCAGRVPVIHAKDGTVDGAGKVAFEACGEGVLNWDEIVPACEAQGVKWYAVEQDTCPRDQFDCLKSSFDFLTAKGI